jgi:uncharacterized protein YcfJ
MKPLFTLPMIAFVAACANSGADYQPVLDGPRSVGFQSDLSACRTLAKRQSQFDRNTMASAALGAGTGAVLGELDNDGDALAGAVIGALAGGAAGAVEASERREGIVKECMRGRGHNVVG